MATPEEEYRYLAIDLKSFYASVECADRGLDPFSTHLVVADPSRGPGTICLAVSPPSRRTAARPARACGTSRPTCATSWCARACAATWRYRHRLWASTCGAFPRMTCTSTPLTSAS